MQTTITGALYNLQQSEIDQIEFLIRKQNSAKRMIFQDLYKGKNWEEAIKRAQSLITGIPRRYIYSAKEQAKQILDSLRKHQKKVNNKAEKKSKREKIHYTPKILKVIFETKKLLEKRARGLISKEEWRNARNNQLYSEGWKEKKGNLNLRIIQNEGNFQLRITTGDHKWIFADLYIPEKFRALLLEHLNNEPKYTVKILRTKNTKRGSQYLVHITFEVAEAAIVSSFNNGAIGIDINPDRISYTEVDKEGNFISTREIDISNCLNMRTNKTINFLSNKLTELINYSLSMGKGLVFEDLKFKHDESYGKRLNRIFSNFSHRIIVSLLISKCLRKGIQFKQVNPAFTSNIGKLKYSKMYNLSIHQSAAYVIARRGLGFKERISKHFQSLLKRWKQEQVSNWKCWSFLSKKLLSSNKAVLTKRHSNAFKLKLRDQNNILAMEFT